MKTNLSFEFITVRTEAVIRRFVQDAGRATSPSGFEHAINGARGAWQLWADLAELPYARNPEAALSETAACLEALFANERFGASQLRPTDEGGSPGAQSTLG